MYRAQNYVKAETAEQAYQFNQKKNNAILGGGCWLRLGHRTIGTLIDLSGLGLGQIEDQEDQVVLGAMVTLRQLETSPLLRQHFGSLFAEMTRHIVGVQFRNCATLGGSLASRFGFSDILTGLLALDCQVELAGAGVMPLSQYAAQPYDRDVLLRVMVRKNGRRAAYQSMRNTQTDLPVLTCAVSCAGDGALRAVVGARPHRAMVLDNLTPETLAEAVAGLPYGSNLRAGADYRRHLSRVLSRRALEELQKEAAR